MKRILATLMTLLLACPIASAEGVEFQSTFNNYTFTLPAQSVQLTIEDSIKQQPDLILEMTVKEIITNQMEFYCTNETGKLDVLVQIVPDSGITHNDLNEAPEVFLDILELLYHHYDLTSKKVEVLNNYTILHYDYLLNDSEISDYFLISNSGSNYKISFCNMTEADEHAIMETFVIVEPEVSEEATSTDSPSNN